MDFDFESNSTVEKIETVPEQFRGLYVEVVEGEDKGKHVLGDHAKGIVEAYTGTTRSLVSVRADKKKASDESADRRKSLRAYEDILEFLDLDEDSRTAEGLKARVEELVGAAKNGSELKVNLAKLKTEYENKYSADMTAKDEEIAGLRSDIHTTKISDAAVREILKAKGSIDLLQPVVEKQCKVVKDDNGKYVVRAVDAQGDFRSNGAGGWMGVAEVVAGLKSNEAFARAFDSEAPSGSGIKPGVASRTVTKAGEELTSNEKIARGLAKKAGK